MVFVASTALGLALVGARSPRVRLLGAGWIVASIGYLLFVEYVSSGFSNFP